MVVFFHFWLDNLLHPKNLGNDLLCQFQPSVHTQKTLDPPTPGFQNVPFQFIDRLGSGFHVTLIHMLHVWNIYTPVN